MAGIPEIVDCPYYLISRASLAITNVLRRELTEAGAGHVRPAYLGVLMCLWRQDGVKGVELGRCAGLEPSTITGLLDRMQRDGLLERRPDPHDRRAQRIFLTAAGREIQKPAERVVQRNLERVMAGVSELEAKQLKRTLRAILNAAQRENG
jgi:DNA-binding MarR family transcriptional regulator